MRCQTVISEIGIFLLLSACGGGQSESVLPSSQDPEEVHGGYSGLWIEVVDDRVSLRATDVQLGQLLTALADHSELIVVRGGKLPDRITLAFQRLRLEDAISRILLDRNYVYQFGSPSASDGTQLMTLHVLGPVVDTDDTATALEMALFDSAPGVRIDAVAQLQGIEDSSDYLSVALVDEDVSVRLEAVELLSVARVSDRVDLFTLALGDSSPVVREAALEALFETYTDTLAGKQEVDARLVSLLEMATIDVDPGVREEAEDLLALRDGLFQSNDQRKPMEGISGSSVTGSPVTR